MTAYQQSTHSRVFFFLIGEAQDDIVDQIEYPTIDQNQNEYCFKSIDGQARTLSTLTQLNIWDNLLYASARYPFGEISKRPPYVIDHSAFSDPSYRDRFLLNHDNGLVGVETSMTQLAAPQSICDQSTIALLTLIYDKYQYGVINSELPPGYNSSWKIRFTDCNRSRSYGLKLMRIKLALLLPTYSPSIECRLCLQS